MAGCACLHALLPKPSSVLRAQRRPVRLQPAGAAGACDRKKWRARDGASPGGMRLGWLRLALCAAGIYAAYLTQGLVQEDLSTRRYGPNAERFTHIVFLNLAQSVVCLVWAGLWLLLRRPAADTAPCRLFWRAAVSNTLGPACGVLALKNISYTAQVLAKSCKLIPVMVVGTVLYGKRYSALEYVAAALIAGGISLFAAVKNSGAVTAKLAAPNAPVGYVLVLLNLWLDAYTNASQDRIKERFKTTTPQQLMCYMNAWCSLYYAAYMFVGSGAGFEAIAFCYAHPEAARQVLLYCICGAAGQNFIFAAISSYGSLVNITITTTRKFFSVLFSVFYNKSDLRPAQWSGVALVFAGLTLQIVLKQRRTGKGGKRE